MLRAWAVSGFAGYSMDLIPEVVFMKSTVAIGYGNAIQEVPDNLVSILSEDESSKLFSSAIPISFQLGVSAKFGHIVLSADGSYRLWNISEWSYWAKSADETEIVDMDQEFVLYPEVNLGGLYFKLGLSFEL